MATIVSNVISGTQMVVTLSTGDVMTYNGTPPDARSVSQWQTDCGNEALNLVGSTLGDGAPSATLSDDDMTASG